MMSRSAIARSDGLLYSATILSHNRSLVALPSLRGREMRDDGFPDPFEGWKRERDAIEHEMKLFLAEGRRASVEDRQARQVQFAALIERRNIAMRNLLQSASNRSMTGAARDQETMRPLSPSPETAEEARTAAL